MNMMKSHLAPELVDALGARDAVDALVLGDADLALAGAGQDELLLERAGDDRGARSREQERIAPGDGFRVFQDLQRARPEEGVAAVLLLLLLMRCVAQLVDLLGPRRFALQLEEACSG